MLVKYARKYHKLLGFIFALPLLWAVVTACAAVTAEKVFHNEALGDYIIKFHTLEIFGLDDIYPFILLFGIVGLVATAFMMQKRK